jgi:prevent-host-death family protein
MKVSISEVKAKLSKFVNMVHHGQRVVIMKNNVPLVDLIPHQAQGERTLGLYAGQIAIPDDFSDEDEQINEMFFG